MKWKKRTPVGKPSNKEPIINQLAKVRGIKDLDDFLNPSPEHLISPYMLSNIEVVANRIILAIHNGENIVVSADCDSDGIFSTAMMVRYLRQFTNNVSYIYNQRSEGHGIENQLDYIQDNTDLLVILDSSTNSVKACKEIKSRGVDILILDHHTYEVDNPHATIVNPQCDDYPNKDISGAGVTYKVIEVIDNTLNSETVDDFLDLCAMGMYADLMDVSVPENRYIIIQGMKNINNKGIEAILDLKKVNIEDVNSQTIGFTISPLINGSARLDKIELALRLLMEDDYSICLSIASELININEQRKTREAHLFNQYTSEMDLSSNILIATDEMASKGFNGLVATRISQEFQRPSMVLRDHKGTLAGSYRTYGDFNMQKFLRESGLVKYAEGHTFAGGVALFKKDLEEFKSYISDELKDFTFDSYVEYDLQIDADSITEDLIKEVEKFNYLTGKGFPEVIFKVTGIMVDTDDRVIIGKNKNVLKWSCGDITIMKFKVDSNYANDIPDMSEIEVVGQLNLNVWHGWKGTTITKQVFMEDYRIVN